MKKIVLITLCLFSQNGLAAPVENAMVDPTLMTDALKQGIEVINATRQHNEPSQNSTPENQQGLGDPTRMNQNFRDALLNGIKNTTENVTGGVKIAPEEPLFPKITLLAKMQPTNKSFGHIILRVNDKSEMVSLGDTITYFQRGELITIEVGEITKNYVKVTVKPINQTLILR
jgi:hypothetical protein